MLRASEFFNANILIVNDKKPMERQDGRTLSMQALVERRRRAVQLREKGVRVNDVARECELSRGTVIAAHKAYCLGGWAGWH
jgi:DNA-binding NarL/FixJ family response regulator